jgi:osmotically-inducible protein OsmY
MRTLHLTLPLAMFAACSGGQDSTAHAANSPSNTAVNTRDQGGSTLTPMDQSNATADLDHLSVIRKAITADEQLSTAAKNVKVFTKSGAVTLRGTAPTALERTRLEQIATAAAATTSIDNQIQVEPK